MTAVEPWQAWASANQGMVWVLPEVDSTQEAIKRAFAELTTPPEWAACIAHAQTAGRGRQGHAWISAAGEGLWFSLMVPSWEPASTVGRPEHAIPPPIALLAAAALCDELRAEGFAVDIKWPNDLWLNAAKVGGILVEAWRHQGKRYWIIGVGLNWQAPSIPDLPDKLGASSAAAGLLTGAPDTPARRHALAQKLLAGVRDALCAPSSWPQRMAALQENHLLWQRRVSVWVQGEKITEGRAGALTPRGELMLMTDVGDSLIIGGSASVREIP